MRKTYAVANVEFEKVEDGTRMFLVHWEDGSRTWEPVDFLKGSIEFVVRAAKRHAARVCCPSCSGHLLAALEEE
jgi:hypothetical protein